MSMCLKPKENRIKQKDTPRNSGRRKGRFFCVKPFLDRARRSTFWSLIAVAVFTGLVAGSSFSARAAQEGQRELSGDQLYAQSAVLLDGESGRVLFGKEENKPMANASTTKILTCITVLENCDWDEELTVSAYAASMPKVKLGLRRGEKYRVKDLLYSMMLESHNDSAAALAEHVGRKWVTELSGKDTAEYGKEESMEALNAFADKMNAKALEIGCSDTYFITPNGLDAERKVTDADGREQILEHHTTARDLARILAYCILKSPQKEDFTEITKTGEYRFKANGREFYCSNHNLFLQMMKGAVSGKTGYTGKAGYCYVGALEQDGRYYVVALLACGWPDHKTYKWQDTRKLMQYGMDHFRRIDLSKEGYAFPEKALPGIRVKGAEADFPCREKRIGLRIAGRGEGEFGVLIREDEKIGVEVLLPEEILAPVRKGQKVGEIRYMLGGEILLTENVEAAQEAEKWNYLWCLRQLFGRYRDCRLIPKSELFSN